MLRERFGEGRAAFDRFGGPAENLFDCGVFRLLFKCAERADQRQPRAQQNRQLTRDHGQILAFDLDRADGHVEGALLFLRAGFLDILRPADLLDHRREHSLALQLCGNGVFGSGGRLALLLLAGRIHRCVSELRHFIFSGLI